MNIPNISKSISQLLGIQKDIYIQDIEEIILSKDNFLNEFSFSENSVRLIYDHVNNKIIYISDNVEALGGYPIKNYYKLGLPFLFQIFTFEHYDFYYRWWKWSYETHIKHGASSKS